MKRFLLFAGFICIYIALDAASFIHPLHGLNITPWNPAPALGLVYLLRSGATARLPVVIAIVLGEWLLRGVPSSWWASLFSALILAAGYIALGETLKRYLPPGTLLDDRASLLKWILPITLGTLLNALVYLTCLRVLGLLPAEGWLEGVLRFWVGDAVGIAVAMPLLWWLTADRGRSVLRSFALRWETVGYALLTVGVLWMSFGLSDGDGFKLFYFLMLPIVWASTRQGMAGAIISATLLQAGLIIAVRSLNYSAVSIAELQILALVMTLVGFFTGSLVDEQRRTSEELRQTLRLAAAGEMAGALAHELNQPLTALSAYASACEALLARGESGERLNTSIKGMLAESARAGDVVRRLRDFFRTGATRLETIVLADIVARAVKPFRERAISANIDLHIGTMPDVSLLADHLQLEVVLRNLLSNAFDAVASTPAPHRSIRLSAEKLPGGRVVLSVEDSGSGLNENEATRLFEPFNSSKSSGLGLGLVISRAITETHGGSLWGEVADHGIFRLSLPIQEVARHE